MDLGVREWMIIIGVLLIVAVVLDGYRRVRNERRGRIRVSLSRQARRAARSGDDVALEPDPTPAANPLLDNPELPNGGARPASRRRGFGGGSVPVLMQPVDQPASDETSRGRRHPDVDSHATQDDDAWRDDNHEAGLDAWDDQPFAGENAAEPEDAADTDYSTDRYYRPERKNSGYWPVRNRDERDDDGHDDEAQDYAEEKVDRFSSTPSGYREPEVRSRAVEPDPLFDDERFADDLPDDAEADDAPASPLGSDRPPQEVLVIYVVSRDRQGFKGQDLLQILLACDVRYAKSRVFYRYEEAKGQGPVQFGVASLTEEGTFDLDSMDEQLIPGVCFFLTLPGPVKSLNAFSYMVETAQVLVKNLGGELRDESRSVMTAQTLEHYRQRIRDFERKQLTFHL